MVRGRKTNDSRASSDLAISGHLSDWAELAVDYVDDRVDAPTKTVIQAHLDSCPDCARRLAAQQSALALYAHTPLVDTPAGLEARVLEKLLAVSEPAQAMSHGARRRSARRPRTFRSPAGPWLPALAGGAAVLAMVLALTVSRSPATPDGTMTTAYAVLSSEAGAAEALSDSAADLSSTTATALSASGDATVDPPRSVTTLGDTNVRLSVSLQPTGVYLQDRAAMVEGLAQASVPAYFFFDTEDGALVTTGQADTIASQLTAATGLRLMDQDLSSGVKAFAAFVPREDSAALVDLLRSVSDSLQLNVRLSLQPGAEVTSWATAMFQDKYSLAELSAAPSQPAGPTSWSYTTSTASTTTSGDAIAPKATLPDQAGTHVLVVIFMAVRD
jgi:hypothetical protein